MRTGRIALAAAAALIGAATAAAAAPAPATLELLSQYDVPAGLPYDGTCLGGLSALEYDPASGRYYALSDAGRDARFYAFDIPFAAGYADTDAAAPRIAAVSVRGVTRLTTREGVPYADDRVDPEGFRLLGDGTAFVSSEGAADRGVPPFVDRIDVASGAFLQALPIPLAFHPLHEDGEQRRGVRRNFGFEALAITPDRRHLVTASESALAQDLPPGGVRAGATLYARLLRYALAPEPRLVDTYLYPLVQPPGDVVVHGLVELLALDDDRFLALERTFANDTGMTVKLFEMRLVGAGGAADPSGLSPEARQLPVVAKRLLVDFGELGIRLDNFEGLTLGPPLQDGESLLVLGDNDNVACQPSLDPSRQRSTRLLLFRLRR